MKSAPISTWMAMAIMLVGALAYWDEQREAAAALDDFAQEQATLALGVASALRARLMTTDGGTSALLDTVRVVEHAGERRVFLRRPGATLIDTDGRAVDSSPIEAALDGNVGSLRLTRPEAAALGLPARMAMAGLVAIDVDRGGRWGVAVVATAQRVRDREERARWRLLLGVVVASWLVLVFGSMAMRKGRKELELSHALAIEQVRREADERLVRADKLATMGALATGIAHEISTPLSVIVGRAEQLVERVQGNERATRALQGIVEQSARIERVVRGFLGLARGDSPPLELTDPKDLVAAARGLVEHRFAKAGVELTHEVASDLPRVSCEPRLFEQVLVNLLLNACDACEPGGRVHLVARASEESVVFEIADDGEGIAKDAAARAIEPFFTTKPAGEGTGLGLAIANEIVKHHRGSLALRSRESGRGTVAEVTLPIPDVDEAKNA